MSLKTYWVLVSGFQNFVSAGYLFTVNGSKEQNTEKPRKSRLKRHFNDFVSSTNYNILKVVSSVIAALSDKFIQYHEG